MGVVVWNAASYRFDGYKWHYLKISKQVKMGQEG
jgi:hypothetical protein